MPRSKRPSPKPTTPISGSDSPPPVTLADYKAIQSAPFGPHLLDAWEEFESIYGRAELGRIDRFYLLVVLFNRTDVWNPWLYERCREVEANPDGFLDLWAREHYKSTIITYAGVIQEILRNPDTTIGIFSHTKPVARKFLVQIKTELEQNKLLQALYPNVLYGDPQNESPRWSEEKGIVVKRKTNPKEATVEAHGLVDGQPIGAHYMLRVYDDVVTIESVSTPEQIKKTTYAWEMSDNLSARGEDGHSRAWHIGTRYTFADTYNEILEKQALTPRIYPATDNGQADGTPVFLPPEVWEVKKKTQSSQVLAAQMLQNPVAGNTVMLQKEWLRFYDVRPITLTVYILVDPSSGRKRASNDRTAIAVVGIDAQWNYWLLDGYCHRMGLAERWQLMRQLRRTWSFMPGVQAVKVGYERFGMDSDLEFFEIEMQRSKDYFEIHELAYPREGPASKYDRIQRLEPLFRSGKFWLAQANDKPTRRQEEVKQAGQHFRVFEPLRHRDENGELYSLNKRFLEEYLNYPFSTRDDFLDVVSRIFDIEPVAPVFVAKETLEPQVFVDGV